MVQERKFGRLLPRQAFERFPRLSSVYVLRALWMLAVCVLVGAGGGCSTLQGVRDYVQYNDFTDDVVIGWRNYVWANNAWHARKAQYACEAQLRDFGEGFRAGYRDVAAGSNGCPPPLPPRNYWSWKYQSPEGQGKIAAWFAGYPHGAQAAEEDCAGNWRQIPVSHVIEQQYSPEFAQAQIPRCDGSCFPQPEGGLRPDPNVQPGDALPTPFGVPNDGSLPRLVPAPDRSLPGNGAATWRQVPDSSPPAAHRGGVMCADYQAPYHSDRAVATVREASSPSPETRGEASPYSVFAALPDSLRPYNRPATAGAYWGGNEVGKEPWRTSNWSRGRQIPE